MRTHSHPCLAAVALGVALAVLATGCSLNRGRSTADKAGGSTAPLVLRLAASDPVDLAESPLARYFAAEVARLSGGKLRVEVTFQAAGTGAPDVEARTVELVRSGRFDLGWVATRVWDELGVSSFQALQAPFLITSYPLLDRVVTGPLAREMLAGLQGRRLVGLTLVPGLLRHPVGFAHAFVSPADFAGARIRDLPSRATDELLAALGAKPVHVGNAAVERAIEGRRIVGEELSLPNSPIGGIVAANVSFFPKVMTLFAGQAAFHHLSQAQQEILRRAAAKTLAHNSGFPVGAALAFEATLARRYCRVPGHIALAGEQQLASLAKAAQPVYGELERDPQTKTLITRIQKLKASLPSPPPIAVPRACLGSQPPAAATTGAPRSAGALNGTYHWLLTAAAARAFGSPATDPGNEYPAVEVAILRDGRWMLPNERPVLSGTYTVSGNRIAFHSGSDLTFTYVRDADGTLRLTAVPPMNRGDRFVFSGAPWRRVGPPTAIVP